MNIVEVVIQGLKKESGSNQVEENFRNTSLSIDQKMTVLGEGLLKSYSKTINNYGCFDENRNIYTFPGFLDSYLNHSSNIVDFSKITSQLIKRQMESSRFATGGYALFIRYHSQGRDWLIIAMLKLKPSTGIDEKSLDLNEYFSFDITNLHEAVRIDIEKYKKNEQPYLSFIKKGKKDDVTIYFRTALGCTDYTDSKSNTVAVKDAIDAYADDQKFSTDQYREIKKKIYDYFEECRAEKTPVNLKALSAIINSQEPDSFVEFVRKNEYPVNEVFSPHKETYIKYKRIAKSFRTVKLSFEIDDLYNQSIYFNEANKSVTITRVPDDFIEEMRKAIRKDSDESEDSNSE